MPINITYILSNINKSIAFEWITEKINRDKFKLWFILLNPSNSELEDYLIKHDIPFIRINYSGKKDFFKALFRTIKHLKKTSPDILHCHLFDATLIGLLAGKLAGIKKRIYTRHHSTYNHTYNPKGIYIDRIFNHLATDIVAISKNVEQILLSRENVAKQKVHLIHHGFDLEGFENVNESKIHALKAKYGVKGKPVIGVIARWIEWKGIQDIIPAFKKKLTNCPEAVLILANANGPYAEKISDLLNDLPNESFRIIEFEYDLFSLYHLFDVYVHTPIDPEIEAFGQTYVEALAAGIPSVFTLSGIAHEFIQHERNALVVPYKSPDAIFNSMRRLIEDQALAKNIIKNGRKDVEQFQLSNMIRKLEDLYENQNSIQNT